MQLDGLQSQIFAFRRFVIVAGVIPVPPTLILALVIVTSTVSTELLLAMSFENTRFWLMAPLDLLHASNVRGVIYWVC